MNIEQVLEKVPGARIVRLRTKTQVKMLARGKLAFPKGVSKISSRNGIVGANYENCVNNQLEREGKEAEFTSQSLWSGRGRTVSKFIVEHTETGKRYIKFLPNPERTESIYVDNSTGLELDFEVVKPYLPAFKEPNQGTEKPVFWLTVELDNILGLTSGELCYNK